MKERGGSNTGEPGTSFFVGVLEKVRDGVLVVDEKGRVAWVNRACRGYGLLLEGVELPALPEDVLMPGAIREALVLKIGRHPRKPELRSFGHRRTLPATAQKRMSAPVGEGNELLHLEVEFMPGEEAGLAAGTLCCLFHDRTEQMLIREDYSQRMAKIELSTEAKGEFLANISHELRTPMTSIIGMGHILLESDLDAEQRESAEIIFRSAHSLLNLINDTLDFSKLEAGKVTLENIPFNLYGLVEQICQALMPQIQSKNLELLVDFGKDMPRLFCGDPGRVRQILLNFLSNAIKFTEKGFILTSAEYLSEDQGRCRLRLKVKDTGIGIPKKYHHLIFDKFAQADSTTTRKYGGTGLGLTICRQLAGLMGGEIGFSSEAGVGSSFWAEVNLGLQKEQPRPLVRANLTGCRILAVDDNPASLRITQEQLASAGLRCDTALSSHGVVDRLREARIEGVPYDLAILDYYMPGMDGAELGAAIKADSEVGGVRLVMLTSLGKKGDGAQLRDIGYDGYLVKPVSRDLLVDMLSCVLGSDREGDTKGDILTKYTLYEESITQGESLVGVQKFSGKPGAASGEEVLPASLLVVEDDPGIQRILKRIFKGSAFGVSVVDDGSKALALARERAFDVVLMDLHMPVMDGVEATRRIREMEGDARHTWIIGLTAGLGEDVEETLIHAGMDACLPKPFDITVIKEAVRSGIEHSRRMNRQLRR
ncbi:MAG: response regulator [Planctomycetes bacterium]|nr:response regulator [Planctomycetota bacterium]